MRVDFALAVAGVAYILCTPMHATMAQNTPQSPPPGMTCPGDKIVWVNMRSHVYHFEGERYFGNTARGKFMCEHDADKAGDRPTHNGQ